MLRKSYSSGADECSYECSSAEVSAGSMETRLINEIELVVELLLEEEGDSIGESIFNVICADDGS